MTIFHGLALDQEVQWSSIDEVSNRSHEMMSEGPRDEVRLRGIE